MNNFPVLFISHGSPDLPLQPNPVCDFLRQLGDRLGKPQEILVISAHWLAQRPTVSTAERMETIHDFGGFPQALYQMTYPAPGAPRLAARVQALLSEAAIDHAVHPSRGLDHGAWEPLLMMYPQADIPVTQLSLQPHWSTRDHWQLGRALAPLRDEGVLVLASGSTTHNLRMFGSYELQDAPPDWVTQFDQWLARSLTTDQTPENLDALLDYRHQAPYAVQNHPTEEHLLPLFVALGAGGDRPTVSQLHSSFTYGVFSMAAYAFN